MPLYEPIIPTRYLMAVSNCLDEAGQRWFLEQMAQAGVSGPALSDARAIVPMATFDRLFAAAIEHSGRTDLGFEIGLKMRPGDHGPLVPLFYRCSTLEQVFQTVSRYFRLITPIFSQQFLRHADHGEYLCRPAAPMSAPTLNGLMELYAASIHHYVQAAVGVPLVAYDVHLSIAPPPHLQRYRELRPARYHFRSGNLPQLQVLVPDEILKAPLGWRTTVPADADLDLDRLQSHIGRARQWSDWIRLMLGEAEGCQPTIDDFAGLLNVSSRTLSRTLAQEGMSLREMSKQVRRERACAMLADPAQAISQIAYRLGYTDVANFSHAFSTMAGQSPRAYRSAVAPGSASISGPL